MKNSYSGIQSYNSFLDSFSQDQVEQAIITLQALLSHSGYFPYFDQVHLVILEVTGSRLCIMKIGSEQIKESFAIVANFFTKKTGIRLERMPVFRYFEELTIPSKHCFHVCKPLVDFVRDYKIKD